MEASNPYAPPAALDPPPHRAVLHPRLASIGIRVEASVLDGILALAVCVPALLVGAIARGNGAGGAWILIVTLVGFYAYQWYLVSTTGQTLGKRWRDIRIVQLDGSPATFVSAVLLRSWVFTVLTAIPLVGAMLYYADIVMFLGSEHRTVHDRLAGTMVIRV
jgi:uncharacterized RDD family membrane protein YckC